MAININTIVKIISFNPNFKGLKNNSSNKLFIVNPNIKNVKKFLI
jgi:hypothetical protein